MQIWNLPHHPRAWHQLKHKSPWFYPLHAPCTQLAHVYTQPIHIQPTCTHTLYTDRPCGHQKIGFSVNPRILSSRSMTLLKLWCIHEILLSLSSSQYIFNHAQEIHTNKKLSINTPKDILTRSSPLIHKRDSHQMYFSQEILASYLYFHLLGHLTHF